MHYEGDIAIIRHSVGARIRMLRKEQGLSQYKFASMTGIDRSYLIRVEKGERNVSVDNLIKISLGLGVPLSFMFEGVDVEYQQRPREAE